MRAFTRGETEIMFTAIIESFGDVTRLSDVHPFDSLGAQCTGCWEARMSGKELSQHTISRLFFAAGSAMNNAIF